MTIESDFETLIDELETNLQAMGVYDAEFDAVTGIRGLVARIIDINPSLTGVALTTAISCSSSHQTVVMGNTIIISGVLTATYDDRSVTNVDLSGYLQGATINIYNGQTLLGTAITDSNGAYTFSYTTNAITNLSILAQFDGTDDYSSCTSSNVAVSVTGEITLTSNKNILSAADNETAILTAHLTDTVIENVSINFYKEGNNMAKTLIGTATTDANGVATITYTATGAGDVTIQAESGSLVTERYDIQDCSYYNTAEVTRSSTNGSTIYDNSLSQALPSKCEISLDIWSDNTNTGEHRFFIMPKTQYSSGTTQPQYAIYFDMLRNNQMAFGKRENNSSQSVGFPSVTATSGTYHTVKFVKDETSISVYVDDNLIGSFILSWIDNYTDYCMSMMRWSASGTSKIKNVKFKPL